MLAWQTTWCSDYQIALEPQAVLRDQLSTMLQELETMLGKEQVGFIFNALITTCCILHVQIILFLVYPNVSVICNFIEDESKFYQFC